MIFELHFHKMLQIYLHEWSHSKNKAMWPKLEMQLEWVICDWSPIDTEMTSQGK